MTSTKNQGFDPLPLSIWAGPPPPLWTSTRGRHEIHTALLKRLVQWPSRPKLKFDYKIVFSKTVPVLLVIYITNLYRRKMSTFYFVHKGEILVKKTPTSLHEKTGWRQWTLILIFCVDVHMRPLRKWMAPKVGLLCQDQVQITAPLFESRFQWRTWREI